MHRKARKRLKVKKIGARREGLEIFVLHDPAGAELHHKGQAGQVEVVQEKAGFLGMLLKERIHVHEKNLCLVVGQGSGGGEGFLATAAAFRVEDQVIGLAEGEDALLGCLAE